MSARILLILSLLLTTAAAETVLDIGGDVRIRGYALDNMWDLDSGADGDHWSLFRQRTRLHVRADLDRGVTGFVQIANQHWGEGVTTGDAWEADNKSNKLFVDAAWIDVPRVLDLPVDLRLGRQNVTYGSGFVLFDGQSQTASTSIYLDGLRARLGTAATLQLDLLYFKDQENVRADLAADDLTLSGAYLQRDRGGQQALYLLRREDQSLGRDITVLGGRAAGVAAGSFDYAFEAALQRGDAAPGVDHEAWGVKSEIGASFPCLKSRPRLFVGFVGMSGDDPATAVDERWDVVYGGWPQYGDLLAWTYLNLGPGNGVAGLDPGYAAGSSTPGEVVYGNLLMPSAGLELRPRDDLDCRASIAPLSFHRAPGASDNLGLYTQLNVRYRYSPQLAFALYAARLDPGDAFGPDADAVHEVFWEAALSF